MSLKGENWFELSKQERLARYAQRKARLDEILVQARIHRMDDCEGAPLCLGSAAADMLEHIPPWEWMDVLSTCLAHLVDDAQEIENLRAERDRLRDRSDAAEGRAARFERESNAGWEAYRAEAAKRRLEVPPDEDEP